MNDKTIKKYLYTLPTIILLFIVTAVPVSSHPFYFSLSEIKINVPQKRMEISCKLFTDDLENALDQLNKHKIDLATSTKDNKVNAVLYSYLSERFKIWINGKPIILKFVGFEVENEVTWCYLETDVDIKPTNKMNLMNSLLYDFLPDQTNLVEFECQKINTTERVNKPDKEINFNF
ncbi:MAG: DUF6702 family protein [Bacteroidia bacterium]